VSALSPSPKCPVDVMVDTSKGLFARGMTMVVGPSTDNGIEFSNQAVGTETTAFGFDDGSNLCQESFLAFG